MEVRQVSAMNGWGWIVGGFQLFRQTPVIWLVLFLVYLLIGMALSIVPVVGPIMLNLLAPVFIAGFMLGCRALDAGEDLEINHLFGGFKQNTAQLITVGGIYLAGMIAVVGVILLTGGGDALSTVLKQDPAAQNAAINASAGEGFLLASMLGLACLLPLVMAYWFAPPLVVFNDMKAVDAMKLSLTACVRNWRPFLVYSLLTMALMLLAALPLGLGLLVMIPTMTASLYVSYRDIFSVDFVEAETTTATET